MKSILLSLDLLFATLIFSALLAYSSITFEYENTPSLYYYDASNALDFLNSEISSKNAFAINNSVYNYLGFKGYYLDIKYYNASGLVQNITIGDFKHKSNYCSQKYYMINSEIVNANLCIWRDYE
ncbi:MAG: hypothetical protein PHN56_06425 [Candidatus Nanoarchaeia archaeon]|nr:hypothetical protein [Candidatus Nanoarchaeia archaeon]